MSRFTPNPARRLKQEKLGEFVPKLTDGQIVSWLEIEQQTSVQMDREGQALFRLALKRGRRPYIPLPGRGVQLSSPKNGLEIVDGKWRRIVSAVNVGRETTEQVAARHLNDMPQEDKNKMLHHQALFSTLELSSSLAKKLPPKESPPSHKT